MRRRGSPHCAVAAPADPGARRPTRGAESRRGAVGEAAAVGSATLVRSAPEPDTDQSRATFSRRLARAPWVGSSEVPPGRLRAGGDLDSR